MLSEDREAHVQFSGTLSPSQVAEVQNLKQ